MDSFSPSPGTSPATAPSNYMRACQGCNGAKVKCTARADDDSNSPLPCARCFRLKKECLPILPKTRKRRSPNARTRTANLEKKLEDLVSLLAAQQQPSSTFVSPASVSGEDLQDNHYSRASSIPSSQTVSAFEAVELLTRYRTCLTPNFPFVIIADDMSAQQLQQQKPYLFESILMAASYRDPDCQAAMAKELLRKLTTSIVLKAESNLDLLQALIVYIAWFHLHSHIKKVTSVLHLAMGLVSDLGLKSPQLKEKRDVIGYTINSETRIEQNDEIHSPDEKRAFLGCFMLASMASMCLKLSDGFRYLPYIETCCNSLSTQTGHNSDYILSVSVRLQGIIERMQDTFSHGHGTSKDCRPPLYLQVNFYCKELELFKSSLPLHIQQDYHFTLQYHNAKLNLYESVIQKTPSSDYTPASLQQLDMLHGCVLACKQFFDVCFMMTPENFATLAFLDFGRLGYALATLFKLSLFKAPGWDLTHVRKTIDLSVVLDRLIYQFERTINPATARQDIAQANDAFTLGARRLRRVKEWLDANPPATEHGAEKQSHGTFLPFSDFGNFDMNDPRHFFDEISWQEITGTLDIVP